jgi:hypothetical protein
MMLLNHIRHLLVVDSSYPDKTVGMITPLDIRDEEMNISWLYLSQHSASNARLTVLYVIVTVCVTEFGLYAAVRKKCVRKLPILRSSSY